MLIKKPKPQDRSLTHPFTPGNILCLHNSLNDKFVGLLVKVITIPTLHVKPFVFTAQVLRWDDCPDNVTKTINFGVEPYGATWVYWSGDSNISMAQIAAAHHAY